MIITKKRRPPSFFVERCQPSKSMGSVMSCTRVGTDKPIFINPNCTWKPTWNPRAEDAKVGHWNLLEGPMGKPWKFPGFAKKKNTWDICKCEFGPKFSCFYYLQTKQPKTRLESRPADARETSGRTDATQSVVASSVDLQWSWSPHLSAVRPWDYLDDGLPGFG